MYRVAVRIPGSVTFYSENVEHRRPADLTRAEVLNYDFDTWVQWSKDGVEWSTCCELD